MYFICIQDQFSMQLIKFYACKSESLSSTLT